MLGLQISHDKSNQIIWLNQSAYINSILNHFSLSTCHKITIPLATNHNLSLLQFSKTSENAKSDAKYARGTNYLSMVESLLYATQTCSDIQFAMSLVAQFANNPSILHLITQKCILCYLKNTRNYGLVLSRFANSSEFSRME